MANFYQAGYAYLQILPSLKGFPEALEAGLRGINPELKVSIKPDIDTAPVEAASERAGENAGKKYSDAFGQMVNARIRAALEALPAIKPEVDATEAQLAFADLREELESLADQRIGVDIDPADALIALAEIRDKLRDIEFDAENPIDIRVDATTASAKLDDLLTKVRDLDRFHSTIDVSLNEADFALAEAQLEKLRRDAENSQSGVDNSGSNVRTPIGAGGGRLGYLAQLAAVGGTLGGGAISSAALLTIPLAFAAIGVAAEKSDSQVKTSFKDLENTAKSVTQQAFSPMLGTFEGLASEGSSALRSLQGPLTEAASAASPLIRTLGDGLISAVEHGTQDTGAQLTQLRPVVDALSHGFDQLEGGIAQFFEKLDKQTAGTALTSLFGVVQQLLPALAALLNAVTPLGTALAAVLGSAIRSTAGALETLSPVLDVVAGALQSVSGFVGAASPLILAFLVTVRLMTGSWTNFSGAVERSSGIWNNITGLFNTQSTQFARLASLIGITTAAENKRTQDMALSNQLLADNAAQEAELAQAKAKAAANTAEATSVEAAEAATLDKSTAAQEASSAAALEAAQARNRLAQADIALIEADEAAAAAEEALGETTDAMTFSIAPILGIVAAAGAVLGLFALQNHNSAAAVRDVSGQLVQMGRGVEGVNANLAGSDGDLTKYSQDLDKIGSSVSAFSRAYSGSVQSAQQYTNGLVSQQKKLADQVVTVTQSFKTYDAQGNQNGTTTQRYSETVAQLATQVNGNAEAFNALTGPQQEAVTRYNSLNNILPQAKNALADVKAEIAATAQALALQGVTLSSTQTFWNNYGNSVAQNVKNFNDATSGIKSLTDANVNADAAFFQAKAQMQQLSDAAKQAAQAEDQARQGVSSAAHGVTQAVQGVADARHQEQQSILGVQAAEQQLQQARQQEVQSEQAVVQAQVQSRQAQLALTQARVDAAQAIKDLNRQVVDQGDAEADARVRLVQAQQAVRQAGLEGRTLGSFGAPTASNLANYELVLQLQEAQHNLNDQLAQGSQLSQQQSTANRAGINGSQQVIAANQAIVQSQQQLQQSIESANQAKQGVATASQGVANASYQEQQAHLAVKEASYQEQQASAALITAKSALTAATAAKKLAQDNDTTSVELNTAQGVQNFQMIETLFEDNFQASGDIGLATAATEQQGQQMHIAASKVDEVIQKVTGLNGMNAVFGVVGEPSINLSELINSAVKAGIDPHADLGFSTAAVGNARASGSGIFPTHANGGLISGPGTATSDSIMAYGPDAGFHRVSNGEFVVNADATAKNLPLLHQINSGMVPGHADGGVINPDLNAITKANFRLSEIGGAFQAIRSALNSTGVQTAGLPALPHKNPADALQLGVDLGGGGGPQLFGGGDQSVHSASAQLAQAYARSQLARYGWGPDQMPPLTSLWNQESGWNDLIVNQSSGAYGIPQALPADKMASAGPDWRTNYKTQINWGLGYIDDRYHTPAAAWAHEVSHNWYDQGGFLPPGISVVHNATGHPEPVFNPQQWDAIQHGGLGGFQGPMRISGTLLVNGLESMIDGRIEAADAATGQLVSSGTR